MFGIGGCCAVVVVGEGDLLGVAHGGVAVDARAGVVVDVFGSGLSCGDVVEEGAGAADDRRVHDTAGGVAGAHVVAGLVGDEGVGESLVIDRDAVAAGEGGDVGDADGAAGGAGLAEFCAGVPAVGAAGAVRADPRAEVAEGGGDVGVVVGVGGEEEFADDGFDAELVFVDGGDVGHASEVFGGFVGEVVGAGGAGGVLVEDDGHDHVSE